MDRTDYPGTRTAMSGRVDPNDPGSDRCDWGCVVSAAQAPASHLVNRPRTRRGRTRERESVQPVRSSPIAIGRRVGWQACAFHAREVDLVEPMTDAVQAGTDVALVDPAEGSGVGRCVGNLAGRAGDRGDFDGRVAARREGGARGGAGPRRHEGGGPRTSSAAAPRVRANGSQPHGGHGSAGVGRRGRRGLSEGGGLPRVSPKRTRDDPSGARRGLRASAAARREGGQPRSTGRLYFLTRRWM